MNKTKILIVDDSDINRYVLESMLTNFEVLEASNDAEMYDILNVHNVDLILLDVMMPKKNGHEIAIELSETTKYCDIPIIFVSAKDTAEDILQGFESGGFDYVTKPVDEIILKARINSVLKHSKKEQTLEKQAITDPLTGIYNRRYFFERARQDWDLVIRHSRLMTVCMIDIDHFKNVNDQYGHDIGDFILVEISKLLHENLRLSDLLARYGGEEFIIMFSGYTKEEAFLACMRIRQSINQHVFEMNGQRIKLTLTYGLADMSDLKGKGALNSQSLDTLIKIADQRLYHGKQSGRNMISMQGES